MQLQLQRITFNWKGTPPTDAEPTYYIELFKYGYRKSVVIWRLNDWRIVNLLNPQMNEE